MKKIGVLIVLVISFAFALNLYVPVDDPVYDFLERQAVRGFNNGYMNDTKPLDRNEVALYLVKILENEKKLHRVDAHLLNSYLLEYRAEISDKKHMLLTESVDSRFSLSSWENFESDMTALVLDDIWEEEKHIYLLEDNKNTIWINTDFTVRGEGKNEKLRYYDKLGFETSIQLGNSFALFTEGNIHHQLIIEEWEGPSQELIGYPKESNEYFNIIFQAKSYANVEGDFGSIALSYYPMIWGNSINSILLSETAPPFGSITYTKRLKDIKYNFVYGSLTNSEYYFNSNESNFPSKYLVGHHFELHFHPRIQLSFAEMLVYGNRPAELTYIIPFQFLWPTEKVLGGRDNYTLYGGFEILPVDGLKLFASIFSDYFSFSSILENSWTNMFSVQTGLQLSPHVLPADLKIEYTAVHPWTYTGNTTVNSYTHNGSSLGFYLGPNTSLLYTEIDYDITAQHRLSFAHEYIREGSDSVLIGEQYYASGGDVNHIYSEKAPSLNNETKWLMGDIRNINNLRLRWLYRWRNQIEFLTTAQLQISDNRVSMFYSLQVNLRY